jgi:hypothetical protein
LNDLLKREFKMSKEKPVGALIPIAARLARGDALNRLYEICENQKSISTKNLEQLIDDLGDIMKKESAYIRTTYNRITEADKE